MGEGKKWGEFSYKEHIRAYQIEEASKICRMTIKYLCGLDPNSDIEVNIPEDLKEIFKKLYENSNE